MIQLPNNTGQAGVYHTGSPNYVDVDNASAPLAEMVTFATTATADSWANLDTVGIRIEKDAANFKVWTANWDATNEYLLLVTEEQSVGTISDENTVFITASLTRKIVDAVMFEPQIITVSGTTYETTTRGKGHVHCCTNASAVTITLDSGAPVNWQGLFVQEGTGTVSFVRESTDTINGSTAAVEIPEQWKSAYVYHRTEGAWVVVV